MALGSDPLTDLNRPYQQIKDLEIDIRTAINASQSLHRSFSILTSVPGVITAASLIAWMGELGSLTHRQVASLIGVAPFVADSGKLEGFRHIRGDCGRSRNVLYMAALSAQWHFLIWIDRLIYVANMS